MGASPLTFSSTATSVFGPFYASRILQPPAATAAATEKRSLQRWLSQFESIQRSIHGRSTPGHPPSHSARCHPFIISHLTPFIHVAVSRVDHSYRITTVVVTTSSADRLDTGSGASFGHSGNGTIRRIRSIQCRFGACPFVSACVGAVCFVVRRRYRRGGLALPDARLIRCSRIERVKTFTDLRMSFDVSHAITRCVVFPISLVHLIRSTRYHRTGRTAVFDWSDARHLGVQLLCIGS